MPSHEHMIAAVNSYVEAFARQDAQAITRLFAPGATVEDPVGSPPQQGMEAIRAFYTRAVATGAKLTLDGPVRVATTSVAFAFTVRTPSNQIDVIDTFQFDERGAVAAMRAFWGPQNVRVR